MFTVKWQHYVSMHGGLYHKNIASPVICIRQTCVLLIVSTGINVNCHRWQTLHKQDWCEQEAVNVSVRFMPHSRHIRFTINPVWAAKWDASCLSWQPLLRQCFQIRRINKFQYRHFPASSELCRTFMIQTVRMAPLLMASLLVLKQGVPAHQQHLLLTWLRWSRWNGLDCSSQ